MSSAVATSVPFSHSTVQIGEKTIKYRKAIAVTEAVKEAMKKVFSIDAELSQLLLANDLLHVSQGLADRCYSFTINMMKECKLIDEDCQMDDQTKAIVQAAITVFPHENSFQVKDLQEIIGTSTPKKVVTLNHGDKPRSLSNVKSVYARIARAEEEADQSGPGASSLLFTNLLAGKATDRVSGLDIRGILEGNQLLRRDSLTKEVVQSAIKRNGSTSLSLLDIEGIYTQ